MINKNFKQDNKYINIQKKCINTQKYISIQNLVYLLKSEINFLGFSTYFLNDSCSSKMSH